MNDTRKMRWAITLCLMACSCHKLLPLDAHGGPPGDARASELPGERVLEQPPTLPPGLRLVYGCKGSSNPLRGRTWQTATAKLPWGPEETIASWSSSDDLVMWAAHQLSPVRPGSEVAAALTVTTSSGTDSTTLHLLNRTPAGWDHQAYATSMTQAASARRMDLAYESKSGEALVVYAMADSNLAYRRFLGGAWTEEKKVWSDQLLPGREHQADWVRLVANPTSDEITLAYEDWYNGKLYLVTWDGKNDQWLEFASASDFTVAGGAQDFDLAYEGVSGALMVVYGGISYRRRLTASSPEWTSGKFPSPSDAVWHRITLAAEPGSDRLAGLATGCGYQYHCWVQGLVWDGASWQVDQVIDYPSIHSYSSEVAVGWVGGKGSGLVVGLFERNENDAVAAGKLSSLRWDAQKLWTQPADQPINKMAELAAAQLVPFPDGSRLMAIFSDTDGHLWSASTDGSSWKMHYADETLFDPLLQSNLSSTTTRPFAAAVGLAP
jgi:hypothetical protein